MARKMPKVVWNIVQGVLRSLVKKSKVRTSKGFKRLLKKAFRIGVAKAEEVGYTKKGTWKELTPKGKGKQATLKKVKMSWESVKKGGLNYVRKIAKRYKP